MVSGQNFMVIALHLLARTHLCLDGCWRSQDPRSLLEITRLGLGLDVQVMLIRYRLESVGFIVTQGNNKEVKCQLLEI